MITRAQAMIELEFHAGCSARVTPQGVVKLHTVIWRRAGRTQTWARRRFDFRVLVKNAAGETFYLTQRHAVYALYQCPVCSAVAYYASDPDTLRAHLIELYELQQEPSFFKTINLDTERINHDQ